MRQRRGWNLVLSARFEDGERELAAAAEAWTALGRPGDALEAIAKQVGSLLSRARIGAAGELVHAHRDLAESLADDPESRVGLAWFMEVAGRAAFRSGDHERSIVWSDRALELAEPLRLDEVFVMALITKAAALVSSGRYREGHGPPDRRLRRRAVARAPPGPPAVRRQPRGRPRRDGRRERRWSTRSRGSRRPAAWA